MKQAPTWNAVTLKYKDEPTIAFGDVILSESGGPKGPMSKGPNGGAQKPGEGGWPTIRHYNKATGYDGAPYSKKTKMTMCKELGPPGESEGYMEALVTELIGAVKGSQAEKPATTAASTS
eukprot:SAG31_NODE_9843_length_1221_cov_1.413547_1_plen_119_part_10